MQACTILGGDTGDRPPTADAERARFPPADTDLHLYVSVPPNECRVEAQSQLPSNTSTNQTELFFETELSSVQHDERTDGTDKQPADVHLEPATVMENRTSSFANYLPWRQRTQKGEAINTISAKSYKIRMYIEHTEMYN